MKYNNPIVKGFYPDPSVLYGMQQFSVFSGRTAF